MRKIDIVPFVDFVKGLLRTLRTKITSIHPGISCRIGVIDVANGRQPYISFLRRADSDNIDLCVVCQVVRDKLFVRADVIRGDGLVLSEMPEMIDINDCLEARQLLRQYIEAQEIIINEGISEPEV